MILADKQIVVGNKPERKKNTGFNEIRTHASRLLVEHHYRLSHQVTY